MFAIPGNWEPSLDIEVPIFLSQLNLALARTLAKASIGDLARGMELADPLLPIGMDGSSNYFCVVLTGERWGSVLFFDHEMADTVELADSFSAFLASLRPNEVPIMQTLLDAMRWRKHV